MGRPERVITQEGEDGRDTPDRRVGCVAFPVGDRLCMYAELVGNLPLKKIEVQSPSADVIP